MNAIVLMVAAVLLPFTASRFLPGSPRPYQPDLDDNYVIIAANKIDEHFLSMNQDKNRTLVQVISATKQLVAGYKYKFTLKFNVEDQPSEICKVTLIAQEWLPAPNNYRTTDISCAAEKLLGGDDHDYQPHGKKLLGGDDHDYQPHGKKLLGGDDHDYQPHGKTRVGGQRVVTDMNDPDFVKAMDMFADKMNAIDNSMYRSIPQNGKVTQQIVKGVVYRFTDWEYQHTVCKKSEFTSESECPISNTVLNEMKCSGKVYFNLQTYELSDFYCRK